MGTLLDKPETTKDTETAESDSGLKFGASAMQGWRVNMEDAHTIVANVKDLSGHSFVAVYDGHGGGFSASFAGKAMMGHITATKEFKTYMESDKKDPKLLEKALYQAFLSLDRKLRESHEVKNEGDRSGCTAVAAFVTPSHIVLGHAGDSRAIIASGGEVVVSTEDHKPYNSSEKERIEKAGGCVSMKRVDGDLAVSRALGDFQYKDESLPAEECKVTAAAEVQSRLRDSKDEFLVVACDGIWDVMSDKDCVEAIQKIFDEGETSLGLCCEEMLDTCLFKSSRDNMSMVVVTFPGCKIAATGEGVLGRREQRKAGNVEDGKSGEEEDSNSETAKPVEG